MASAVEGRGEEDLDQALDHLRAGEPFAEREHVRVVVASCQLRRERLADAGTANARHLVRGDRDAQARAADDDPSRHSARRHGLADREAVIRVVDRFGAVRAEVENLVTLSAQLRDDAIFEGEAGMVGGKDDLHSPARFDESAGRARRRRQASATMRVASSSRSFADHFADGRLTQLEWIDHCAGTLALDGIVLDAAHFPRRDDDYLAQIKKLCVDLGLTIAAIASERFFGEEGAPWLRAAELLGAPLIVARTPAAGANADAWPRLVSTASDRTREAKARNVTLAVRSGAGSLCPDAAALKRLAKDCDSAWLRFASELALSRDDLETLAPRSVIGLHELGVDHPVESLARLAPSSRGFTVVDVADATRLPAAVAAIRRRLSPAS